VKREYVVKKLSNILILLVSFSFIQIMILDISKMTNAEKILLYQNEKENPA